jgi:hypothetical protein
LSALGSDESDQLPAVEGAEVAARTLGMQLEPVPVRDTNDFESGFKGVRGADGLLEVGSAEGGKHPRRPRATPACPMATLQRLGPQEMTIKDPSRS